MHGNQADDLEEKFMRAWCYRQVRLTEKGLDHRRRQLGISDDVKLLPEAEEDHVAASNVLFGDPQIYTKKLQQKRKAIHAQSIFASATSTTLARNDARPHDTAVHQTARILPSRLPDLTKRKQRTVKN